jgi:O-antigen ligase
MRWELFGNPNSLGAVMGVVVVPMLLWGLLSAETVMAKRRMGFELLLAILVLMSSFARAGIAAGAVASIMVCATLREYRLLVKGMAAAAVLATAVVMFVPLPEDAPKWDGSQSVISMFLYKGRPDQGLMGSRKGVWDQTWRVIKEHPWFGSGFGTSLTGEDLTNIRFKYTGTHVDTRVVREHGNSYLAISEWVGLLGVVPFYYLIILVGLKTRHAFSRVFRSQNVFSPLLPAAAILTAGLIDVAFEDWLFAVGYYLCVFFWAMAFIMVDLLQEPEAVYSTESVYSMPEAQFMPVATGQ